MKKLVKPTWGVTCNKLIVAINKKKSNTLTLDKLATSKSEISTQREEFKKLDENNPEFKMQLTKICISSQRMLAIQTHNTPFL